MKSPLLCLCVAFGLIARYSFAQNQINTQSGGGEPATFLQAHNQCLSAEKSAQIAHHLAHISDSLGQLLPVHPTPKATVKFRWPLEWASGFSGASFYGVSNFVDHNANAGALQDYTCGTRTYDLSNYNHKGTDIFLWPAPWKMMAQGQVDVVSAAPGVVLAKYDGNFDQNCAMNSGAEWNAVYVRHADNTIAWYGHLKSGSLTTRSVGDSVGEGEYLGKVGSSGSSTGPHLHFEVYQNGNQLIDPWNGTCNTSASLWKTQRPYYDPLILMSQTASGQPTYPTCPQQENLNAKLAFMPGQTVYLTNYYRDMRSGDTTKIWLFSAANQVLDDFYTVHSFAGGHYAGAWWYWFAPIPSNYPLGVYRYVSRFKGVYSTAYFTIGQVSVPEPIAESEVLIWLDKENELHTILNSRIESIAIVDMAGRQVLFSHQPGDTPIRLQGVRPGVYQVRIKTEAGLIFRKISVV